MCKSTIIGGCVRSSLGVLLYCQFLLYINVQEVYIILLQLPMDDCKYDNIVGRPSESNILKPKLGLKAFCQTV